MSLTPTRPLPTSPEAPLPPAEDVRRAPGRGLVVLGVLGTTLLYALAVLTYPGQRVDNALMEAVGLWDRTWWPVPNPYLLLAGSGLLALLGLVRRWRTGLAVAASVSLLMISTQVLKAWLPRPHLADQWVIDNSFPSGHTGAAAALGVALLLVVPRSWIVPAAVLGSAATSYMGLVVTMHAYHRPSDVIASALLAVAALGVGLLVRGRGPSTAVRRT
ncbi:phosphatase PAP2 family protein [Ornithinimicrobium sp. LYQ92]|uniref:phosphatase PAP2 family protein n=1 Tax=Serinicoccus sp. LYQ92 TaxID=3378798 RepID=UPI00385518E1